MTNYLRRLEPGGHLEAHDNYFPVRCDDGTITATIPVCRWSQLLVEATGAIKRPTTVAQRFKEMMEAANFADLVLRRDVWLINRWARHPKLKRLGMWAHASSLTEWRA